MTNQRKFPFSQNDKGKKYDWISWTERTIQKEKEAKKKRQQNDNEQKLTKEEFLNKWSGENQ